MGGYLKWLIVRLENVAKTIFIWMVKNRYNS